MRVANCSRMNDKTTNDSRGRATDAVRGLLRRREIASKCGVSPRTIDDWQKKGVIPFLRLGKRCIRFDLSRVLKALDRFTVQEVK